MPTVKRIGGLQVRIYPNDHPPSHVHVIGPDCEAVFLLNCADGVVELRESFGFNLRQIGQVQRELEDCVGMLCDAWSKIHGRT